MLTLSWQQYILVIAPKSYYRVLPTSLFLRDVYAWEFLNHFSYRYVTYEFPNSPINTLNTARVFDDRILDSIENVSKISSVTFIKLKVYLLIKVKSNVYNTTMNYPIPFILCIWKFKSITLKAIYERVRTWSRTTKTGAMYGRLIWSSSLIVCFFGCLSTWLPTTVRV